MPRLKRLTESSRNVQPLPAQSVAIAGNLSFGQVLCISAPHMRWRVTWMLVRSDLTTRIFARSGRPVPWMCLCLVTCERKLNMSLGMFVNICRRIREREKRKGALSAGIPANVSSQHSKPTNLQTALNCVLSSELHITTRLWRWRVLPQSTHGPCPRCGAGTDRKSGVTTVVKRQT